MEELKAILEENDISGARAILNNEILWNSSKEEKFYNMIELCESYGVFDKHDGEMQEKNIYEYDENNLIDLNTDLTFNFSKERCLLAYKVSRYLNLKDFKIKEDRKKNFSQTENNEYKITSDNNFENRNEDIIKKTLIVGGIIVGVAVLAKVFRKSK